MPRRTPWLLLLGLVALLRLPYLWFPVQGDDNFYLAMAQHALVDPLHPNHFKYLAEGGEVDLRGFPKPPGNAWMLAGAMAILGDIREPALHLLYAGFSLLALWAGWELALVFCRHPRWAVALFAAVPTFVINGNSLEADIPFLAFFLAAMAFLVHGVHKESGAALLLMAIAGGAAALIEYKAIALVPLGALFVWRSSRRRWTLAWLAVLAPALVIGTWQLFERFTTGAASAEVLAGYFQSRGLQSPDKKLRNALALTVHAGWIVSPLLALATFGKFEWLGAGLTALVGAWFVDPSPLFWLPLGCGVAILLRAARWTGDYGEAWPVLYYLFALAAFFSGSARYLLPAAAPIVITTVNRLHGRHTLLAAGLACQLALALALNHANYQHWSGYKSAVDQLKGSLASQRSWIAGEWGLRFYAESEGAAPLRRGQAVRPGDVVVWSRIGQRIEYTTGGGVAAPILEFPVRPSLPLRLLADKSRSAYSTHEGGFRAFDVASEPADVVTAVQIVDRAPQLSFVAMNAPEVSFQIASGVYELQDSWRWTNRRVVALLKRPPVPWPVQATFRIIDQSPVRRATLSVDGKVVAEQAYQSPGLYRIRSEEPFTATGESVTVTLTFDRSFHTAEDARELAAILTGIGFAP